MVIIGRMNSFAVFRHQPDMPFKTNGFTKATPKSTPASISRLLQTILQTKELLTIGQPSTK
jgi:hypothetical protein